MKKFLSMGILLLGFVFSFSQEAINNSSSQTQKEGDEIKHSLFVSNPVMINSNEKSAMIILELLKMNFEKEGYVLTDDSSAKADFIVKSKVIKFDDERAQFTMTMYKNGIAYKTVESILTNEDLLDLFLSRMVVTLESAKKLSETKMYGNAIVEEEPLSMNEEKYKIKGEISLGAYMGNIEYDVLYLDAASPAIHNLPIFFTVGVSYNRPDYFITLKTKSFVQALGMDIGYFKVFSRKPSSYYLGGEIGAGMYWGPDGTGNYNQYFGPSFSASTGYIFNRISSVYIRPEGKLDISYRKINTDNSIIVGVSLYITISI